MPTQVSVINGWISIFPWLVGSGYLTHVMM